jgi:hypothetical protein
MKNTNPRGLFDDQFRLDAISCQGDPLEKLNKHIDWSSNHCWTLFLRGKIAVWEALQHPRKPCEKASHIRTVLIIKLLRSRLVDG